MSKKTYLGLSALLSFSAIAQSVLPFPPTPSASKAKETLRESTHVRRKVPQRLPADAPNILIIMTDDTGPGLPNTYGGEINTPTLSKIANTGISYNRFHSTAMCSPTRAALLTGRNHTRVGNGQISELSNDFTGFSGVIPKSSATVAEVLRDYGYSTAAFGKWHNTPSNETSKAGPFDRWPTGYGFDYFYGFLGGEASQYEPTLVQNTTYVTQPKTAKEGYHLTDDLADNAIGWLNEHKALAPDKPFFMYWAPGAAHGPHQVTKEWADKYKGKFDDGWDKYRERTYKRMMEMGQLPKNAKLTPRPDSLAAWDSIPENQKPFQRRLMEVYAGFVEHADYNAGRVVSAIEKLGMRENTLIFYIWGDNGSSSEGQNGSISELLAENSIPSKIEDHMKALDKIGGLPALGSAKTDNMYHAGWGWAGSTPYQGTKLQGAYFGGTRQPLAVSWPKKIAANKISRSQFHHVNDITPTIYNILKINPPQFVNGIKQDSLDGTSMAYTFNAPNAKSRKDTQFFDIMASRGIYHKGWFAGTRGPRVPWLTVTPGIENWDPRFDTWELYNLEEDFTQSNNVANRYPGKLAQMKRLFMKESMKNFNMPIGGGLLAVFNPSTILQDPHHSFTYVGSINRIPEFAAPKIGTRANIINMDLKIPAEANGVLFALGGYSSGISLSFQDGELVYEYNTMAIERTQIKAKNIPKGDVSISVEFQPKPLIYDTPNKNLQSADVIIKADGKTVAKGEIPTTVPMVFTLTDCLDFGMDLGSPVSEYYYEKAPFKFNGQIEVVKIDYLDVTAPKKETTMVEVSE